MGDSTSSDIAVSEAAPMHKCFLTAQFYGLIEVSRRMIYNGEAISGQPWYHTRTHSHAYVLHTYMRTYARACAYEACVHTHVRARAHTHARRLSHTHVVELKNREERKEDATAHIRPSLLLSFSRQHLRRMEKYRFRPTCTTLTSTTVCQTLMKQLLTIMDLLTSSLLLQ